MTPSTSLSLHQLGPEDASLLRAMTAMFAEAFDEVEEYTGAPPGDAYLRRVLESDCFIALAATKDDEVVGGLAAYELKKFERERSEIYVYDLAVAEAHRRQGIATSLLLEMKEIAAARGAYVVFIQADAGDEPAIALYSKWGTREDAVHFDIRVK